MLFTLPFSREFSLRSAESFEREILAGAIGVRGVVAGANFHYGHNRSGTLSSLARAGQVNGFEVVEAPTLLDERGEAFSSTRIRQALGDARPDEAAHLLGRYWEIESVVEKGDQRGRQLGFPTANGSLGDLLRPAYGIYAVEARIGKRPDAKVHHGVASIGIRPMWRTDEPLIETHIFNFAEDIYGQHIRVSLVAYLRPEIHFESVDALTVQIARDCDEARQRLDVAGGASGVFS